MSIEMANWKYQQRKKALEGGAARRETEAMMKVMKHFRDGGEVLMNGTKIDDPKWNWVDYDYEIVIKKVVK